MEKEYTDIQKNINNNQNKVDTDLANTHEAVELALSEVRNAVSSIKVEATTHKFDTKDPLHFPHNPVGKVAAILNTVFGSLLTLGFGIPVFVLSLVGGNPNVIFGLSIPLILGLTMDVSAAVLFGRVKRYKRYMNLFKGRSFCFVDELAAFSGLNSDFVLKDIQKMLYRGTFPQGHLVQERSLILLTRESYDLYILEERKRKMFGEELKQKNQDIPVILEVNNTVIEGREFIHQVDAANANIHDYEVSDKVIRLSDIINQVINHIEKHPEQSGNLRRFIQFYLPSTVKLLNAYAEFEKHSIKSENVTTAKSEIKNSLDLIIKAFEMLFNNLFAGISMDISTDISVLQTMLAKEGLTKNDF